MNTDTHKRPRARKLAAALATASLTLLAFTANAGAAFDITKFDGGAFLSNGDPATQAGSHPNSASTEFRLSQELRAPSPFFTLEFSTGKFKDVVVDLPPGLIGNPRGVPTCTIAQINAGQGEGGACPIGSQIGTITLWKNGFLGGGPGQPTPFVEPLYLMKAPHGTAALLGFIVDPVAAFISIDVRGDGDYGVTATSLNVPVTMDLAGVTVEVWGVPADPSHDAERGLNSHAPPNRGCIVGATGTLSGNLCPSPNVADPKVFFTLPTSCTGPVETSVSITSWEGGADGASFLSHDNASPIPAPIGGTDCEDVPFTPSVDISPTSTAADSSSGVDAHISIPPDGLLDPDGISQSHLRKTVVKLPEGISVNPSSAAGLAGCSDAHLGVLPASVERQVLYGVPFTLSYDDQTTAPIPPGGGAATVQSALEALPSIGAGNVDVAGAGVGAWRVRFVGDLAGRDVDLLSGTNTEVQSVAVTASGGTFTLAYLGQETAPIAFDATPAAVQAALEALPAIGAGNVSVLGGNGGIGTPAPYYIAFQGALGGVDAATLTADAAALTGGAHTAVVRDVSIGGQPVVATTQETGGKPRFTDSEPSCPPASKIGTVDIESPLIEEHLTGEVVLRTPKSTDPMSGDMLRLAIVARSEERGILIKLPGAATADPDTGRLTATFDDNPQLPFSDLNVEFKSGSRGVLAMPQDCGALAIDTILTPWSGNVPDLSDTRFDVSGDCSLGFAPKLAAGMNTPAARSHGEFTFDLSRQDGEQWVDGLSAQLPRGLLASVKGVPLCPSAAAAAGSCPAGSRIGTVDASAGTGSDPFVLERKGSVYLTEGYKGCAYGLAVKVPVVAGPFDKSSPQTDLGDIVVRQAVCVDPTTAEITATSDPFPTIWHGIPLRVRSVTVKVDRSGFMLNPSDCSAKSVGAMFDSSRGASSSASDRFQASGCASLPFKPKLALSLTGRKQVTTGRHPGINAQVTQQGTSEAGIEKAVVRLPRSLALDPNNAQALCEFADGTKPDLENHCPKGSIVGRARARTPLLEDDLVGNVYFVKNIRIDPRTGNQIRTLPMIIVALRGEIAINLVGESSTTKRGKLVNTFANVPDAPISRFNLNIKGGSNGIIAVTRTRRAKINLCAGRHIAEADTDGQNGRRHDFDIRMKTPCTKRQVKRAKRAAARAAKARTARR